MTLCNDTHARLMRFWHCMGLVPMQAACDAHMGVFLRCIDAAAQARGQGFAAIKVTALGNPMLLERVSNGLLAIRNLFSAFDLNQDDVVTRDEFSAVGSGIRRLHECMLGGFLPVYRVCGLSCTSRAPHCWHVHFHHPACGCTLCGLP